MGNTCSLRARPQTPAPIPWPTTTVNLIHPTTSSYIPPEYDTAPETIEQTESSST